ARSQSPAVRRRSRMVTRSSPLDRLTSPSRIHSTFDRTTVMFTTSRTESLQASRRRFRPQREALEDRVLLSGGFSDSFEGTHLDPFWSPSIASGSINLTSDQSYSGKQSVQFSSTKTDNNKYILLNHTFQTPVYGRFSVW